MSAAGKRFLWVGNKMDSLVVGARLGDGSVGGGSDSSDVAAAKGAAFSGDAAVLEDAARRKFSRIPDAIFISAKQHKHIDVLKQRLVDQVLQGNTAAEGTIVTNARHYHALQQVADSLSTIHKGLDDLLPGDLLALDIRHCLHYLGEITGEITSEDRLDYIFSKFCIGK
jgi:tRNA U34 5-carboxymethylaminomethyl modifying GTPase MnmE/TrmE